MNVADKNKVITELLNGTITSFQTVVPLPFQTEKPKLLGAPLHLNYGVLIGMTGDVEGNLLLTGDTNVFSSIGESMFGMALEGEMLTSFSGELGNMIAGNVSTIIAQGGYRIDISPPTIIQGKTSLSGYKKGIHLKFVWENMGNMESYFLLD